MNSPLPKPTPPIKSDDKQQNVVFDQKIPLAQKQTPITSAQTAGVTGPSAVQNTSTQAAASPSATTTKPATEDSLTPPPSTLKPTLPPTSLSALSSMSSNKIPGGASSQPQTSPMPQRTVLGQPIPQAIRGESAPTAFGKPAPSSNSGGFAQTAVTTPPVGSVKQESVTTPVSRESKQGSATANQPVQSQNSNKPKFAEAKSPIMKFLPFIGGGVVLLIIIVFVLSKVFGGSTTSVSNNQSPTTPGTGQTGRTTPRTEVPAEQVTIEYWGLWEPTEVMDQVITDFENENPGIKVNYVKQSHVDYRARLQTAVQSGTGPDLFRFHASWTPMLKAILDPIPASVATASELKNNYYPVVSEQLVFSGQYIGLPLMYDGLVLFYNEDILDTASETPPTSWPELRNLAVKLTVSSSTGGIQRGGLAIGNATNVEHFSDILATLILQNGGNLSEADSVETRDALLFYTNFQLKDKVWNETLPNSTVAFARGDVAMMFAPSWRAHEIKAINPNLKFATASMPQLSDEEKTTWASYWAEGISAQSKKKTEAAKFLAFLNRSDILKKFYSSASQVRGFGEIYPKVDMADEISQDSVIGSILEDATFAKSGYMNSFTHDNGINDQTISYYKTAIDALLDGTDIEDVQLTLSQGITQVLKQYGVSTK